MNTSKQQVKKPQFDKHGNIIKFRPIKKRYCKYCGRSGIALNQVDSCLRCGILED